MDGEREWGKRRGDRRERERERERERGREKEKRMGLERAYCVR